MKKFMKTIPLLMTDLLLLEMKYSVAQLRPEARFSKFEARINSSYHLKMAYEWKLRAICFAML